MHRESTFLKRLADLSPAKQALLEKRLRDERQQEGDRTTDIPRRAQEDAAPLSFAQQRLWFMQQWEPESAVYNEVVAIRLSGPLHVEALTLAVREIMRRHEVLRSTYPTVDGQAQQLIDPSVHESLTIDLIDLREVPAGEREAEMQRRIAREVQRPFHLGQEVPWRRLLLRLDEQEHIALTVMHHIITDAWSMEVFVGELTTLYAAFSTGEASPLPQTPLQYADYACWQRQRLEEGKLERQRAYWKGQLGGTLPVLELLTDAPRPAVQTFHGRRHPVVINQSLSQALQALGRREGATVFMTLLAAFKVVLSRYSGQEDVVVGTAIANRTRPELEQLLGCFVNTLALRTDLSGNPAFRDLLQRVREVTLGAYEHQDVPFEKVVEDVQVARSLRHATLCQVMFELQNVPLAEQELAGLTLRPVEVEHTTAKFELSLCLRESGQGLNGYLEYNTDLFKGSTIERFVGHFLTVLEAVVADPGQRIADLPLLTEAELQQMLVEWNATAAPYSHESCFHRLFEEQVKRTPEAVAVVCGREQLTFRQLNQHANQLAYYLQERGVGSEHVVALLADRGIPFLTATLAIFKAGGTYLPLDPQHPAARLRYVLEHSRCRIILTTSAFAATINPVLEEMLAEERSQIIVLESVPEQPRENLSTETTPLHLAYVIYTSGSTGKPKGAMVAQRGMLNHLYAKIEALQLKEIDRVAQTASQCFDISVWQFLSALLVGGQVQIFPDEVTHDPVALLTQVEQQNISILEIVPSMLRALIDLLESTGSPRPKLAALRWLISTGDILPAELCRRWLSLYPRIPLLNAFGPTECSDDVTHHLIEVLPAQAASSMPIGRAIGNTRLYVLDDGMKPVPIGVSGELYVGGVGVGRGYLAEAARTAEAFVPDPFSKQPGEQLYKTGDVARYLADGILEFLGRRDSQVKLRGYRIELGEIEAVLSQQPEVRECAVLAREDIPGNARLVAYVARQPEQACPAEELQSRMKEMLPEYMVPAAFVFLEALPLTPNGKLDRQSLPSPRENQLMAETTYVAPRTPIETELAAIWSQLLGVERVGIHDNFFEVGGHSLLVTQAVARIRDIFEVELPLRVLFKVSTVAELAQAIERVKARSEELRKPAVAPVAREAYRLKRSALAEVSETSQVKMEG